MKYLLIAVFTVTLLGVLGNSFAQLSGTYTVDGGSAASATNYQNLTSAVSDMVSGTRTDGGPVQGSGVGGAVTFDIAGTAGTPITYTEQLDISAISGASAVNTILFKSVAGDRTAVKIEFSDIVDNYVIRFNACSYVTFQLVTIENKTSTLAKESYAVDFYLAATNNTLDNCLLQTRIIATTSSDQDYSVVHANETVVQSNNIVKNSTIKFGSYGVYFRYGFTTTRWSGIELTDNIFDSQYRYGMYLYRMQAPLITGNNITPGTYSAYKAIYVYDCDGSGLKVNNNTISLGQNGIEVNATSGNNFEVTGNTIAVKSSGEAIYLTGSPGSNFLITGNTLTVATGGKGIYTTGSGGESMKINDNIITMESSTNNNGIYVTTLYNNLQIDGNEISGNGYTGIYISGIATSGNEALISNNLITLNGTTYRHLNLNSSDFINVYNNSLHYYGSTSNSNSALLYMGSSSNDVQIINNVLSNQAPGTYSYCLYIAGGIIDVSAISNNDYFFAGTNIGRLVSTSYSSFASWIAATSESGSVNVDPKFISNTDLRLDDATTTLAETGVSLASVTVDVDGSTRSDPSTIGGYEVPPAGGPTITVTSSFTTFTSTLNSPSVSQSFTVAGADLTNDITVTPPTNFEISDDDAGFSSNALMLAHSGGVVSTTTLYLRYKPLTTGIHNGNVSSTSTGATTRDKAVTGNCALEGTYTIGGSTPDYTTFTTAITEMTTVGVNGAVIFNVRNGTYSENLTITQITGASLTNNITFKSENSDSSVVTLTASAVTTLILDGADYLRFKWMTIATTGSKRVIELINGATNNKFRNNRLNGYSITGNNNTYCIVYSSNTATLDINNEFHYNVFTQGSRGISMLGQATNTETGTVISNNEFVTQGGYGIFLEYSDGLIISNNSLKHTSTSAYKGINLEYCDGKSQLKKNKVWLTSGAGWGIRFYQCKSTSGNESEIFNNFLTVTGTSGNGYGLRLEYAEYVKVYNNNVHCSHTSTSTSAAAIYTTGTTSLMHYDIRNNIFENSGGGYAAYLSNVAGIDNLDYNDYYSSGTNLGRWVNTNCTDIAAWRVQTSGTFDDNSLELDPSYTDGANGDLHIGNASLEAVGVTLADITNDYDNKARPAPPTIGAHEKGTAPGITVEGTLTAFLTVVGTPTSAQTFTVEGQDLTADIVLTAPTEYQIQEQGVGPWGTTVTLTESGGTVSTTTIEVRYNPASAGTHAGNVVCTSTGAYDKNVAATGRSTNCAAGAFSGTFTINPALAASCSNYKTIGDAISDMIDGTRADDDKYFHGPGIDGIIYFDIADGTYTEQLKIDNISGTYDSIIFKSASGDYTDVTIRYSCPQDGDINNYVIRFDGAQKVTLRNLTVEAYGGSTYSKVIDFTGGATNNKILKNNLFSVTTTSQGNDRRAIVASPMDFNNDNNEVSYNVITNGSHGIYFSGKAFNNQEAGTIITGNTITNSWFKGIHFGNQNAPKANYNTIATNSTRTDYVGIYGYYADNGLKIQKNTIYTNTAYGNGIYLLYCDGTAGAYGEISNNMVYIGAGGSEYNYGIQVNVCDYQKIYYNSAVSNSTNTLNSGELNCAFKSFNYGSNQKVINNVFLNAAGGLSIYVHRGISVSALDYNDLYSTGSILGRWETTSSADATLASWQTVAPGTYDDNSISTDPVFESAVSPFDLHIKSTSPCIDAAVDLPGEVTDDIDDQPRATDIGADEEGGVLPIELLHFAAKPEQGEVLLDWITASETNNDFFTIERSPFGFDFTEIGFVDGAGNSNQLLDYQWIDHHPIKGRNYYRLQQTDYDGTSDYSDIVVVDFQENRKIKLYPNPTEGIVSIELAGKQEYSLVISNILGEVIHSENFTVQDEKAVKEYDLSEFGRGIYFVQISDANTTVTENIIVF